MNTNMVHSMCVHHQQDKNSHSGLHNNTLLQKLIRDNPVIFFKSPKIKKLKKLTVIANHLKSWILWNIWDRWSVKQFIALDERNCCYNSTSYRLNQFIEVFTFFTVICMQWLTLKSQAKNKLNERLISLVWQC